MPPSPNSRINYDLSILIFRISILYILSSYRKSGFWSVLLLIWNRIIAITTYLLLFNDKDILFNIIQYSTYLFNITQL